MSKIYVGLMHYPVYNKLGEIITTSVTNLDLHDISRLCATYDVQQFYVIQPDIHQQELVKELIGFWQTDHGQQYNADRYEAFRTISVQNTLDDVIKDIGEQTQVVNMVITDAQLKPHAVSYNEMRQKFLQDDNIGYLILFGTGWGIGESIVSSAHYCLEPIYGKGAYNHLSVRSAAAIILDRLLH